MPNEFANTQHACAGIRAGPANSENIIESVLPIRIGGHHALLRVACIVTDPGKTFSKSVALTAVVLIRDHVRTGGGCGLENITELLA